MTAVLPTRPGRGRTPLRSRLARVAELAATPLVPADYLDLLDPLRNPTQLRARVLEARPAARDAVTLVLQPGRGWRGHVPGQYVRLGVDVDGVRHWRAYSVTSGPGEPLAVTVKAIPDGLVSNHLVRRLPAGAVVQLDHATGDFTMTTPAPRKALFVTGGSGLTPVMGMLRHHRLPDAVLVHSAPAPEDVLFADDLRAMAGDGRVRLHLLHTDADGLLDLERLRSLVPDADERETWACGPTGLLDLLEAGLPSVRTERFRPSVLAVGEGGTVSYGDLATVEAGGGQTLLDAGESAGVLMPSGCRMGICFGCVLPLRDGAVRDLRDGTVTTAGDGVLVQTCVSAAAGSCHLDLPRRTA